MQLQFSCCNLIGCSRRVCVCVQVRLAECKRERERERECRSNDKHDKEGEQICK